MMRGFGMDGAGVGGGSDGGFAAGAVIQPWLPSPSKRTLPEGVGWRGQADSGKSPLRAACDIRLPYARHGSRFAQLGDTHAPSATGRRRYARYRNALSEQAQTGAAY